MKKLLILLLLLAGCGSPPLYKEFYTPQDYSTFYCKFERMVRVANPKMPHSEIMGLGTAIWEGVGGSYPEACLFASIGVAESHYREQKTYIRFKGYHGAHNGTLLASAKRAGLRKKNSRTYLLEHWRKDKVSATYYAAKQFVWLERIYGPDTLKVWVGGERWLTDKLWNQRVHGYERMVLRIHNDWFVEDGGKCGNGS